MTYQLPSQSTGAFFISPQAVQHLTETAPDTSGDHRDLFNLPFDQLKRGYPRNIAAHLIKSSKRVEGSLSERLKSIPYYGHKIASLPIPQVAKFTSTDGIQVFGEDYEMENTPLATDSRDLHPSDVLIAMEDGRVGDLLGVANQMEEVDRIRNLQLAAESLNSANAAAGTFQQELVDAAMLVGAAPGGAGTQSLQLGMNSLQGLLAKTAKQREAVAQSTEGAGVQADTGKPSRQAPKTPGAPPALPPLSDEEEDESGSEKLPGNTAPAPGKVAKKPAPKLPSLPDDLSDISGQEPAPVPKDTPALGSSSTPLPTPDLYLSTSSSPCGGANKQGQQLIPDTRVATTLTKLSLCTGLNDKYKKDGLSPVDVMSDFYLISKKIYMLLAIQDEDIFRHTDLYRRLHELDNIRKSMLQDVNKDLKPMVSDPDSHPTEEIQYLQMLSAELSLASKDFDKRISITMDAEGVFVQNILTLRWCLESNKKHKAQAGNMLSPMFEDLLQNVRIEFSNNNQRLESVMKEMVNEREQRVHLRGKIIELEADIADYVTAVNQLTTHVNTLNSIVSARGFSNVISSLQSHIVTATSNQVPAPQLSVQQPQVVTSVPEPVLVKIRKAVDDDIMIQVGNNNPDADTEFLKLVECTPNHHKYYDMLACKYPGMLTKAQICAIHYAIAGAVPGLYLSTQTALEKYVNPIPEGSRRPLDFIMADIHNGGKREVVKVLTQPNPVVNLAPSTVSLQPGNTVSMSALEMRLRAKK